MKKALLFTLVIIILSAAMSLGVLFYKTIDPNDVISAFSSNQINLVIEDEPIELENTPVIDEDKVFVPISTIKKYIHKDLELDAKNNRIYINVDDPEFKLETDKLDNRINKNMRLNFLTQNIDNSHYINISGLEKLLGISATYSQGSNILIIDKIKSQQKLGQVKKEIRLRPRKNSFSFALDKLGKGEELTVFDEDEKWLKVRTKEGYIGYALKKEVDITTKEIDVDRQLNSIRDNWTPENNINLVWNYIWKYSPDLSEEDKIEGLDVISPTWFSVVNPEGKVINNGDVEYVKDAHKKGYKVWGLIDNSFDKDLTQQVLASKEAQENVINQILVYSSLYNLDGINIDFENVYYEDQDRLTNFVDELTGALKEQNIIVSMDMTVPSSTPTWSKFYDREELGKILDYCIVMTYDEHWASSPKSGSVASIDWVEKGIQKTLKYIPKEKLLMGIPFYTREWEETVGDNGEVEVNSKALSMGQVKDRLEEHDPDIVWLDDTGQFYVEYTVEDKRYRIWIEDSKSIGLKAQLVHKYDLAGAASWRKGFEEKDVWAVLNDVLKENKEISME